eukprot:TRINITY_DN1958_c0_g1_i2.p1 TRINITY_DN1958_c0_g1~~TRINITY_DN1958_c0_g1_i2.p1  ORF type:complete len:191 (-),score=20.12 TRINITY_DN1958_c0_g1_i2:61-633(-)
MGGAVATCFAAKYSDRLYSLTLFAPAGTPVQLPLAAKIITWPIIGYSLYYLLAKKMMVNYVQKNNFANDFYDISRVKNIDQVRKYTLMQINEKKGYVEAFHSTITNFPLSTFHNAYKMVGELKSQLPVLLMWGDADVLIPLENHKLIKAVIPHAQIEVFENLGHCGLLEDPESINKRLLEWLKLNSKKKK